MTITTTIKNLTDRFQLFILFPLVLIHAVSQGFDISKKLLLSLPCLLPQKRHHLMVGKPPSLYVLMHLSDDLGKIVFYVNVKWEMRLYEYIPNLIYVCYSFSNLNSFKYHNYT